VKAAVYRPEGRASQPYLSAFADGLVRHGISIDFFDRVPRQADFAVVWGERARKVAAGTFRGPILVLERGYVADRQVWTSAGWDGLNGRARFAEINDPDRWNRHFSLLLRPWRHDSGYALLIGQVQTDQSLAGVNINRWYAETAKTLKASGRDVLFRRHPMERPGNRSPDVPGVPELTGNLAEALAGAGLVVTYNSNSAVEAVLAGVATHTADPGSMVYALTSHDLTVMQPPREQHFHRLAWKQWTVGEFETGAAWEIVRTAI
jgi:hypothetical protein